MMKPYSLQAPEDIAKEYGGNKQKIAEAARMGLVDPTAAVMAGMFIDRMRGAQAQEQAQQPTVAQQVFSSPQPALGATPQAAQMTAMQEQYAPRPGARGMDRIPTDPNMMPSAAGGGLVAFAAGDMVEGGYGYNGLTIEDQQRLERERKAAKRTPFYGVPDIETPTLNNPEFDFEQDVQRRLETIQGLYPQGSAYTEGQEYYSPEKVAARGEALKEKTASRAKEDLWTAVALGGLSAAAGAKPSTGSLLGDLAQTLGTAGTAAAPYLLEGMKAKRAAEDKLLTLDEQAMAKRLEMNIAERQEKIAMITPALNSSNAAERAAAERAVAQLNADVTMDRERLSQLGAAARDVTKAESEAELQTQKDIAAKERSKITAEASKYAADAAANKKSEGVIRAEAIRQDEINKRTAAKGSALSQAELDEIDRYAFEQSAIIGLFDKQERTFRENNLAEAKKEFQDRTKPDELRSILREDPAWQQASEQNDTKTMQQREKVIKDKIRKEIANDYGVALSQLGGESRYTDGQKAKDANGKDIYYDAATDNWYYVE